MTIASIIPVVATPAAVFGLVNLYLKFTDEPLMAWVFGVGHGKADDDLFHPPGSVRADVTFRPVGGADLFEVKPGAWRKGSVYERRDSIPKMTCESDPLKVTVTYKPGEAPWVGAYWMRPLRHGGQIQEAVQVNPETGEYRRWKWHTFRNWFRFTRAPKGDWHTARTTRPRERFQIPELEG